MNQPFFSYPHLSDAEDHHLHTIKLLESLQQHDKTLQTLYELFSFEDKRLAVDAFGLKFKNPLGTAAGFDKWGRAVNALFSFGFSHVEVGTVTPLAQSGNPKPRMFRLHEDKALINRFGFNNDGGESLKKTLKQYSPRKFHGIIGGNLGANKVSSEKGDPVPDYVQLIKTIHESVDYLTINISSPNTARLRELHGREALNVLLKAVSEAHKQHCPSKPLLLKISPDLTNEDIDDILDVTGKYSISGIIATNTTVERPGHLKSSTKHETGGLSGEPVRKKANEVISYVYKQTKGKTPIIGVGGIFTAEHVVEKLRAGATLVQTYTGAVYEGPAMAGRICLDLLSFMDREGIKTISEIVGK